MNPDTAEIRVNPDGSVSVFTGSTSMGQGNETAFAQIVSERLGVPPARIQVLWGDSDALGAGFDQHLGKTADASTLVSVVAKLGRTRLAEAS